MVTVDFERLAYNWLRPKMRTPKRLQLVYNFISPITYIYGLFTAFAKTSLNKVTYTCQTMSMEAALNDALDNTERRIWIENSVNDIPITYLYRDADMEQPLYLYRDADDATPFFLYRDVDYESAYDFIVHIPAAASLDETVVAGITNSLRKAGKRFIIQTF